MRRITIPVSAHLITLTNEGASFPPLQDADSVQRDVAGANALWEPAAIQFCIATTQSNSFEYRGSAGRVDERLFGSLATTYPAAKGVSLLAVAGVSELSVAGESVEGLARVPGHSFAARDTEIRWKSARA